VEIKCQLDATEVFIADLIACSTCFGLLKWERHNALCITEIYVIVNNIKTMSAIQKSFCGEFILSATVKRNYVFM